MAARTSRLTKRNPGGPDRPATRGLTHPAFRPAKPVPASFSLDLDPPRQHRRNTSGLLPKLLS